MRDVMTGEMIQLPDIDVSASFPSLPPLHHFPTRPHEPWPMATESTKMFKKADISIALFAED